MRKEPLSGTDKCKKPKLQLVRNPCVKLFIPQCSKTLDFINIYAKESAQVQNSKLKFNKMNRCDIK